MFADFSTKAANAVLILLISRYLGVADLGSYSIANTFQTLGLLVSLWGFGNLLTREVARNRHSYNKYLSNFAIVRFAFAAIAILVINGLLFFLDYLPETQIIIRILSISIISSTLVKLVNSLFIAFEEMKFLSAIALIISIFKILACFLALNFGGTLITIAIIYVITDFIALGISLLFALLFLKDFHLELNIRFCVKQIGIAFPLFWIAVLGILDRRAEILIISFFGNETIVGHYTAMNTILAGITLFSEGIRNAVFPLFARQQTQNSSRLQEMLQILMKYIILITVPISIGVYYFSGPITSLVFGDGYQISAKLLQITIWTFISYSLTVVTTRILMVHDKEKWVAFSFFISGIITIVLNIIFSPLFGLVGVAVVRLLTSLILLGICVYLTSRLGYKIIDVTLLIKLLSAGAVMFWVLHIFNSLNPYLSLFLGLIVYVPIVWFTRTIQPRDINLWKRIVKNS